MGTIILALILSLVMISMAIATLIVRKVRTAVLASGILSLIASILYLLLAAPDVAMTEAAIGSGLTTIIFFYVINKIRRSDV
ncbi:hydrogenase subunit MbhD domain-containing protein [Saccharicrinis sp. FJH62]|uniref:hydrogenase subunit MbhD domain-containing protein n=1 Tax=Saccharicrinis sp. FJH62 TaxID=3344657 RepID=UPI0035D4183D